MVFVGVGYGTVLYFRVRGENHLYSWDTKQTFLEENFMIVRRAKDCRQITHVDVDNNGVLWVLESNIQDFITGKVGCYGPSILLSSVYDTPTPANNDCDPKNSIPDWFMESLLPGTFPVMCRVYIYIFGFRPVYEPQNCNLFFCGVYTFLIVTEPLSSSCIRIATIVPRHPTFNVVDGTTLVRVDFFPYVLLFGR